MSVICGPIARHCSRAEINLWFIATEQYQQIDVQIQSYATGLAIQKQLTTRSVKLATRCYCYMLSVGFALPDQIDSIQYDLFLDGKGIAGDTADNTNGLKEIVCFPGESLPSLYLPKQHTRIFQCSCRKPHDKEGIDQVTEIANQVEASLQSPTRPSQLYMTGDQIYADDVSPILLDYINGQATDLGFAKELFPVKGSLTDLDSRPLDGRKAVANKKNGMSTGKGESHILTFAEYICMYIYCFAGFEDGAGERFALYSQLTSRLRKKKKQKAKPQTYHFSKYRYRKEKRSLESFAANTHSHVRRLLANISSYMIFDDHEVTDDWNLTAYNFEQLRTTAGGIQMHINALSSYLLCQHWGNQPDSVTQSQLNAVSSLSLNDGDAQNARLALKPLWQKDWGFIIEQSPPLVVLDTRTDRKFHGAKLNKLALMSPQRLTTLGDKIEALMPSSTLLVVSPTPMFGLSAIEAVQLKMGKLKSKVDREPWIADKAALEHLQESLMRCGAQNIIVMSGDVHYAFNRRQKIEGKPVNFIQICSSAACNTPVGGNWALPTAHKIRKIFYKKETKYLWPEQPGQNFITTQKNVSSLTLDENLKPFKTTLFCCEDEAINQYIKSIDLVNFNELS